jgi:MoxR-like ATPase
MADGNREQPRTGTPVFPHLGAVRRAASRLFEVFQLPEQGLRQGLFAALLVENAVLLLRGTYGTGKTQLVGLIRKLLFADGQGGYDFDDEACHQELTAFDVLYHLDLAELQRGREVVHPKAMVSARLKFFNEIQRASVGFFNALLPMLAEHRVTYRDREFAVPPFLCVMDCNPLDVGSSEMPEAFLDRVDFSLDIPAMHLAEHLQLQRLRRGRDAYHWGGLEALVEPTLDVACLTEVWADVKRVEIPAKASLLAGMISDAFRLCVVTERSTARSDFDLDCGSCEFRGELCAHISKVPGQRLTNSMLRLAQAMAWLGGERWVREDHLLSALPWCLPHRLALRPEELRKKPSEQAWVQDVALREHLEPRKVNWRRAVELFRQRDLQGLTAMGERDLVVRELAVLLDRGWGASDQEAKAAAAGGARSPWDGTGDGSVAQPQQTTGQAAVRRRLLLKAGAPV